MKTFLIFVLLFAMSLAAQAGNVTYVATTGSDSNDCLSIATACATPMRASVVAGNIGTVNIAAGTYFSIAINIYHSQSVSFIGDCNNRPILYSASGGINAWVQDNATISLRCLRLETVGNYSTAIAARQFSIADWLDVTFGNFPLGTHVVLDEMSKGNCLGAITISGGATTHIIIRGKSYGAINCSMTFSGSPTFGYITVISELSFGLFSAASFIGSVIVNNNSYVLNTSLLRKVFVTIPGPAGTNSNGWVQ